MANRPRPTVLALRFVEMVLLTVGLVSVGWFATAHMSAAREQVALSQELERLSTAPRTASTASSSSRMKAGAARVRVDASAPAAKTALARGLIGRIEVPRLKMDAMAREGIDVRTLRVAVGH